MKLDLSACLPSLIGQSSPSPTLEPTSSIPLYPETSETSGLEQLLDSQIFGWKMAIIGQAGP